MERRRLAVLAIALIAALVSAGVAVAAKPRPLKLRQPLAVSFAGQWRTWWGAATFGPTAVTLASAVPTSPAETHSALITTKKTWTDSTISFNTTTLAQLRAGSAPNTWEVGWVMFRFRDLANYYYFIVKTNGIELGKKQGSDAQIFLATADLPQLAVDRPRAVQVRVKGARIRVSVDGAQVVDFTDPHPLAGPGSVGLYEEDSHVRFDSFATS
jgi:ABC-type glycerol-3-phosphate transport system substrate-binding protein